jgi:hypothetical protein
MNSRENDNIWGADIQIRREQSYLISLIKIMGASTDIETDSI